ncbi:MAG: carotenoid biosynthesis protein [Lactobacillus sp.]
MNKKRTNIIGWSLVGLHILIEILAVVSYKMGQPYQVNYGLFAILVFSYVAATYLFGFKKMVLMNVVSAFFAFLLENTSVSFGFPFGFFEHFAPGLRIVNVPLQVGLGYYFYAFSGWLFADLMIGQSRNDKLLKFGRPLIGAFIASAMDLTTDAINGLVLGGYDYPHGGGFFGSPLTNSLGWILTVFLTLLVWEQFIIPRSRDNNLLTNFHLQNSILLGFQITAPLLGFIFVKNHTVIDVLKNSWQSHYAYEASAMIGLLALIPAMILGIFTWIIRKENR